MRHILRETWSGLRRNGSMNLAVIVTMWVSLTLFGAGLMVTQQVDLLKGNWYDRIEISVFLCVESSRGGTCEPGVSATDAERMAVETALQENPEVRDVYYESKADAWAAFREAYANDPILETMTEEMMQDSFRIKLVNPEEYQGVVSMVKGMPGVQAVRDLREILDPLFALQIGNTIRMAAFSRRREIGIMRLVGASNWYIMLPFLLESLLAALIGAALASGSLAAIQEFVIVRKAKVEIKTVTAWIGWEHVGITVLSLVLLGVVLSIIPTLIATRRFLRV